MIGSGEGESGWTFHGRRLGPPSITATEKEHQAGDHEGWPFTGCPGCPTKDEGSTDPSWYRDLEKRFFGSK